MITNEYDILLDQYDIASTIDHAMPIDYNNTTNNSKNKEDKTMKTVFTADSFGSDCPINWEDICNALNAIVNDRNIADDRDATDELWEEYCSGNIANVPAPVFSRGISLDNGRTFLTAAEAIPEILSNNLWDAVVNMMDDGARETVSAELAPCTEEEFLARYLEIAPDNLIIG